MDNRFGTWNVRRSYRSGSLVIVLKCKLDLVRVQEVKGRAVVPNQQENTFFYRNGNENHELGTSFL
jgi:hypothetical protein